MGTKAWLISILCMCCNPVQASRPARAADLEQIRLDYNVPGMAVLVSQGGVTAPLIYELEYYGGEQSTKTHRLLSENTYFPIASLTKVFSSHLLLSLVKNKQLSLAHQVAVKSATGISHQVTVSELLSHTLIGEHYKPFFYDPRFYQLTQLIEIHGKTTFPSQLEAMLRNEFNSPDIQLYVDQDELPDHLVKHLATAHSVDDINNTLPHDFGVSASAGLISTPKALIQAGVAMLNDKAADKVFDSYPESKGYANGWFRQNLCGQNIVWAYGQYDGFASLWIIDPEHERQLVMLANNNALSDASRLIFGDITASPLTPFFLKHFLPARDCDSANLAERTKLHRDVFFSRYQQQAYADATKRLSTLYPSKQQWIENGDLNLLHLSNYLFTVSHHLNYPAPEWVAHELALVESSKDISNLSQPYWLYYAANVYLRSGKSDDAREMFQRLVELKNMPNHWTLYEAKAWLKQNPID